MDTDALVASTIPPRATLPAEPTLAEVRVLAVEYDLAEPTYRPLLIPDRHLRGKIRRAPTDEAQLTADLLALAALRDANDRPTRLAAWLREAAAHTAPRPASVQFTAWAVLASRPGAFASEDWVSRRRWPIIAGITAALASVFVSAAFFVERPLIWPGPSPVVVELPIGRLRVDRDEAARVDLGDCHLPDPPTSQAAWCAALTEVINVDDIDDIIPEPGRRSVVGLSPAVAERICALRGMRLPRDDEFTALLALGQPAWPLLDEALVPDPAILARLDERGAQRLKHLATGAAEFVRVEGGYRVRGTPLLSVAANRVVEMAPSKALHEVIAPPLGEAMAGPDTGFRCVVTIQ